MRKSIILALFLPLVCAGAARAGTATTSMPVSVTVVPPRHEIQQHVQLPPVTPVAAPGDTHPVPASQGYFYYPSSGDNQ